MTRTGKSSSLPPLMNPLANTLNRLGFGEKKNVANTSKGKKTIGVGYEIFKSLIKAFSGINYSSIDNSTNVNINSHNKTKDKTTILVENNGGKEKENKEEEKTGASVWLAGVALGGALYVVSYVPTSIYAVKGAYSRKNESGKVLHQLVQVENKLKEGNLKQDIKALKTRVTILNENDSREFKASAVKSATLSLIVLGLTACVFSYLHQSQRLKTYGLGMGVVGAIGLVFSVSFPKAEPKAGELLENPKVDGEWSKFPQYISALVTKKAVVTTIPKTIVEWKQHYALQKTYNPKVHKKSLLRHLHDLLAIKTSTKELLFEKMECVKEIMIDSKGDNDTDYSFEVIRKFLEKKAQDLVKKENSEWKEKLGKILESLRREVGASHAGDVEEEEDSLYGVKINKESAYQTFIPPDNYQEMYPSTDFNDSNFMWESFNPNSFIPNVPSEEEVFSGSDL